MSDLNQEVTSLHPMHETRDINNAKFARHKSLFLGNASGVSQHEINVIAKKANASISNIYRKPGVDRWAMVHFETHRDAEVFWKFIHGKTAAEIFPTGPNNENDERQKPLLVSWSVDKKTKDSYFQNDAEEQDEPEVPAPVPAPAPTPVKVKPPVSVEDTIIGSQKPLAPVAPDPAIVNKRVERPIQQYQMQMYPAPPMMYSLPHPMEHMKMMGRSLALNINTPHETILTMVITEQQYAQIRNILLS